MTTITHNYTAIYGSVLTQVDNDGVSPYGNQRFKLTFEDGKVFKTSPGAQFAQEIHFYVGEPVEFTLDPMRRVNELHVVSVFVAKTSGGDRWIVADDMATAQAVQTNSFPDEKIRSIRWASRAPRSQKPLGKRQRAVLAELNGGRSVFHLKPSERKTVYRALLRLGLINVEDGISVTPRGRYLLLAQP